MDAVDVILKLIKEKGISQKELTVAIGVSSGNFSDWKKKRSKPSSNILKKIAEYFNVSVDYLLTGEEKSPQKPNKGVWIPVLGEISAGMPIEAVANIIDYEEIDEQTASSGEYFGLQIKGDSMAPRFVTGDVVIVRKQPDIETGQIAIVLVNGENATVKKINKTAKGIMLIPSNPQYEAVFYSNEDIISLPVTVIGRVVELRAKF